MMSEVNPKIKMTKALPSGIGRYYWSYSGGEIDILMVENCSKSVKILGCDLGESGILSTEELGGYWAKVDQSMFEFEG